MALATTVVPTTVGELTMTGSFDGQVIDCASDAEAHYYAFNSANREINKVTKTLTVNQFRAYFKAPSSSSAKMRIVIVDETTGIEEHYAPGRVDESLTRVIINYDNGVYDLQGRKVKNPTKGLYVVNGKKVSLP